MADISPVTTVSSALKYMPSLRIAGRATPVTQSWNSVALALVTTQCVVGVAHAAASFTRILAVGRGAFIRLADSQLPLPRS